jgi:mannose-6-phosphate isomerase-like protein (cupin superfamily)
MNMPIPPASICEPLRAPAQINSADGSSTWLSRGRTFVVAVSKVKPGSVLSRENNVDEYMLFLSEGMKASVRAGADQLELDGSGDALLVVPPGPSEIRLHGEGWVTRIFSHRAADLAAAAGNAAQQPVDAPDAPPAAPPGGFRLRHYPLAKFIKPDSPARPFRSTNLMVNAFVPRNFRRDVRKMTPHAHADFDQASLALQGSFTHHIRYPWTPDMTSWRDDEHHAVGSPSVIVIPAQSVHTTQDTGEGFVQLVDIFSPPRPDFVEKPGWICNEADYPLAEGVAA